MNVIVDTGCANLTSLKFAIERLGAAITISADKSVINSADRVLLPGVGTAKHAMQNLNALDLVTTIKALEQPVLGICLGMQLMCNSSKEGVDGEVVDCLGIIPTDIITLCQDKANPLRTPHMGWNTFATVSSHPLFNGIKPEDYFYYVHSFGAPVSEYTLASCHYGAYVDPAKGGEGVNFSAALGNKNFCGVQFHPERSGKIGAKLLNNFLEIKP